MKKNHMLRNSELINNTNTTYYTLRTCIWPFRMCVQWWFRWWWQQAGPAFYCILLTFQFSFNCFMFVVRSVFCIILYFNQIHSLHRCIICFFFIALLSYHFGRTFKFVLSNRKKNVRNFCAVFFKNDWHRLVVMMYSIVDMLANYFITAIFLFNWRTSVVCISNEIWFKSRQK